MIACEYCGQRNNDTDKCCWACGGRLNIIPQLISLGTDIDIKWIPEGSSLFYEQDGNPAPAGYIDYWGIIHRIRPKVDIQYKPILNISEKYQKGFIEKLKHLYSMILVKEFDVCR